MRLHNFFIMAVGIGVFSYPALYNQPNDLKTIMAKDEAQQPTPQPRPDKTDFAMRIEINVPATKLTLYDGNNVLMEAPVAVGSFTYKTPIRTEHLESITWNPWWLPPDSEWAKNDKPTPPGPRNPLGPVKLLLGNGIRIHGTNKPSSISTPASHGCIRMFSKDAVSLAWLLQSRLSKYSDPSHLKRYKSNPGKSFYVKLNSVVEVDFIYSPIMLKDDIISVYPDIYGRVKNLNELAKWVLFTNDVSPWELDLNNFPTKPSRVLHLDAQSLSRDNNPLPLP